MTRWERFVEKVSFMMLVALTCGLLALIATVVRHLWLLT